MFLQLLLLPLALLLQEGTPGPPADNVLVIVADDMGVERTPAYGLSVVNNGPAPWISALAGHGVLFRKAYSEPSCSPTRSAILTGKHPFRTGIGRGVGFYSGSGLVEGDPAEVTLADTLGATHRTAAIGKWHLSIRENLGGTEYQHPVLYGFDLHRGPIANLAPNDPNGYVNYVQNIADANGNTQVQVTGSYATSDQVDDALQVIDEAGSEPWFVWLAFNAPHTPFHVPPSELTTLGVTGLSTDSRKHRAAIEAMDTEIGRLLMSIRPAVLARTWIVFVGDNGSPGSTLPGITEAKGTANEFGIHVPLLVVGPGVVAPGREVDSPVGVTDLYASICDMAGVRTPPEAVDSISFMNLLRDPAGIARRQHVFSEGFNPNGAPPYLTHDRAVRDQRYKLRQKLPQGSAPSPLSFFHLATDPFQNVDLLPQLGSAQQAVFEALAGKLEQLKDR